MHLPSTLHVHCMGTCKQYSTNEQLCDRPYQFTIVNHSNTVTKKVAHGIGMWKRMIVSIQTALASEVWSHYSAVA